VFRKLTLIGNVFFLALFGCNSQNDLKELGGEFSHEKIKDYSGFRESSDSYYSFSPSNIEEAKKIIKFAYTNNIPIRFSGRNHSKNGYSLPKKNEYLIRTKNLATLEFIDEKSIKVGSGPSLNHVNRVLKKFNLELPVLNGGADGPSVGGYISAGGMSNTSLENGGFWENVIEVTLVVANGEVLKLRPSDTIFPWLFGSMGQLGLITDAILKVIPRKDGGGAKIPIGRTLNLNSPEYYSETKITSSENPLYWLNFFVKKELASKNKEELEKLRVEFADYFQGNSLPIYDWDIKYKSFNPPLIFPEGQAFALQGLFAQLKPQFGPNDLSLLEKKAESLAKKYGLKRYIQTELSDDPGVYKNNWGENYSKFYSIKKKLDPKFLFNQGFFKGF
jgi:hypothetical protein